MMLRWLVGLLVVANLVFWAWSGGRLDGVTGLSADGDREPERLAQQVEPQAIRLLPDASPAGGAPAASAPRPAASAASGLTIGARPGASASAAGASAALAASASSPQRSAAGASAAMPLAAPASQRAASAASAASASALPRAASAPGAAAAPAAASAPAAAPQPAGSASAAASASSAAAAAGVACLEAGPFTLAELAAARATVAGVLPPGRWSERRQETPGLWMIYMGPYADAEMLQRKKEEVTAIRVAFEEVRGLPGLDAGLSLGRFESRLAADSALARSVTQGIRTARVVMLRPPVTVHHLRVAAPDEALAERLAALRFAAQGRAFRGC